MMLGSGNSLNAMPNVAVDGKVMGLNNLTDVKVVFGTAKPSKSAILAYTDVPVGGLVLFFDTDTATGSFLFIKASSTAVSEVALSTATS